jgi:D-alanyl-D-alanine carboxypeptidase/D-alanyl-D-alanine-endopeptidase (penicillin-binding protein 4)
MRRRGIVVGGLVGITLAGCGGSLHQGHQPAVKSAARVPVAPPVKPATPSLPPPGLAALQTALSGQLKAAGANTGALVYDLTTGVQLFSLRATTPRPPASVEKLYTTYAVLKDLGPEAELQTTVLGTGHLAPGGVWDGNLYVRGGGDPTFGDGTFNQIWEQGYGPTAVQLVAQLRRHGIRRITGSVIGDTSLFDSLPGGPNTGYAPDLPDLGGELSALSYDHGSTDGHVSPGAFAVRELVLTMHGAGIHARARKFTATTPAGAQPLASVSSPPTATLVRLMDVPSDDFFAEMLAKQLGVRFGGAGSTAAGARVISSALAGLDLYPAIVDGSGLSRRDATSPGQVVELLRAVWGTPIGQILRASLPVIGVNGTTRTIAVHTAAQGRCAAKTGTLDYVTNLAGYCDARGGHVLAFALFTDGPSNARAFTLIGKMVAAIARY